MRLRSIDFPALALAFGPAVLFFWGVGWSEPRVWSEPLLLIANLAFIAAPHALAVGFAAKTKTWRSWALYCGLSGANVVLTVYTFGFGDHGAEWLWFVYWPVCAGAVLFGLILGDRLEERLPGLAKSRAENS